jgi:hypothetical protein
VVEDSRTWPKHLVPPVQRTAFARARELALGHEEPVLAAKHTGAQKLYCSPTEISAGIW